MTISPEADYPDTQLRGRNNDFDFEGVGQYKYLVSILRNDCSLEEEIDVRINKASIAFRSTYKLVWRQHKINSKTKMRLFKANVLPVLWYGSESWAPLPQRLQIFINKCVRTICGFSLKAKIRCTKIREMAEIKGGDCILQQRRLRWLGRVERKCEERVSKKLLVSRINGGKKCQEGQKQRWVDVVSKKY